MVDKYVDPNAIAFPPNSNSTLSTESESLIESKLNAGAIAGIAVGAAAVSNIKTEFKPFSSY